MINLVDILKVSIRNRISLKTYDFDPVEYLILDDKKLFYIVISKSACTSIKSTIGKSYDIFSKTQSGLDIHRNSNWKRVFGKLDERYRHYSSFTFVRNPFTRIVSCYKDRVLVNNLHKSYYFSSYPIKIKQNISFEDFVRIISKIPDALSDRHFKSQHYSIKKNKIDVKFIGKVERINEDWSILAEKFNFSKNIVKKNITLGNNDIFQDYYSYYTEKTAKLVFERYKDDFIKFNYENEYSKLLEFLK